ncbi:MAG TPA: site-2 protease family protein [Candidatus Sulfomarinibacteraceae bacterium]|nr:site-2 protease family protein [Candidatus Sulfomarinibacteraceae bacterium]
MIGVPVARILGIEVRLQLGWIFVVALVAALATAQVAESDPAVEPVVRWLLGGVIAFGFFASALAHDLSHALVARRRGVEVRSIVVSFFGGATPLDPASPNPRDELAIAVTGPAASIGLGAGLAIAATAIAAGGASVAIVVAEVLAVLAVLNLILGLVNVIPAYPLDGGRIVRAFAWRRTGLERDGWQAAATSGRIVASLVVVGGAAAILVGQVANGAMIALSGWFLLLSSRAIRERVRANDLIGDLAVGDVMERDGPTVQPGLTVDLVAGQLLDGDVPTTAIPVLRGDEVVGILGFRQVRRLRPAARETARVEDLMAKPPRLPILGSTDRLVPAIEQLQRSGLDGLPVVDDGRLVGVLTRSSIGRAVQARTRPTG